MGGGGFLLNVTMTEEKNDIVPFQFGQSELPGPSKTDEIIVRCPDMAEGDLLCTLNGTVIMALEMIFNVISGHRFHDARPAPGDLDQALSGLLKGCFIQDGD